MSNNVCQAMHPGGVCTVCIVGFYRSLTKSSNESPVRDIPKS